MSFSVLEAQEVEMVIIIMRGMRILMGTLGEYFLYSYSLIYPLVFFVHPDRRSRWRAHCLSKNRLAMVILLPCLPSPFLFVHLSIVKLTMHKNRIQFPYILAFISFVTITMSAMMFDNHKKLVESESFPSFPTFPCHPISSISVISPFI